MPTSKKIGSYASKELRDPKSTYVEKEVAGSDLRQRPKKASTLEQLKKRRRKPSPRK